MGSGEDVEAGRVTTAESTTLLLAAVPSEQDVDFNGPVILLVDTQPGDLRPNVTLDGIRGVGWNRGFPSASPGGTGVVGVGGFNQGTGVVGQGGGVHGNGGGFGVHGIGGSQPMPPTWTPNDPPGAGVVAQGGRMHDWDDKRRPHGAGVIAMAGGSQKPIPPLLDTGSVGVYAQGAEAEVRTANIDNVNTLVGPIAPGPGVLGRGGVPIPREGPVAAGVIGLAGDTAIPSISETGNTGVYGAGPTGVFGHGSTGVLGQGSNGPGVHGAADDDRGGMFESARSAQVQLVPQALRERIPNQVTVTPRALPAGSEPALPKDGRGGDLMVIEMDTEDQRRECTLWFCVQGVSAGPARWAQVLMGPSFDGQA